MPQFWEGTLSGSGQLPEEGSGLEISAEDREVIRLVRSNPRRGKKALGIIVPLEQARQFAEFQQTRQRRGDWRDAAFLAAAALVLLAVGAAAL